MDKIRSYSQAGQDVFVYNILQKNNGSFLDLGCSKPIFINNTYLLESKGWTGISIDILDFHSDWKRDRKNKFIQADCMNLDYNTFLKQYYSTTVIDYLSLDMEGIGDRYKLLTKILNTDYEFKVITIEHDSYMDNETSGDFTNFEKIPQRKLLKEKGYTLLCSDVSQKNHPNLYYEDWWINPKYVTCDGAWVSDKMSCYQIFEKLNIKYDNEYEF